MLPFLAQLAFLAPTLVKFISLKQPCSLMRKSAESGQFEPALGHWLGEFRPIAPSLRALVSVSSRWGSPAPSRAVGRITGDKGALAYLAELG